MDQKIVDMAPLFFVLLGLLGLIYFLYMRGKAYLMFFQQEGYDSKRFRKWWWHNKALDLRASLVLAVGLLVPALHFIAPFGPIWGGWISRHYLKSAKKPLVLTERAKRIFHISLVLTLVYWLAIDRLVGREMPYAYLVLVLLGLQLPPFMIMIANSILSPIEQRVKNRFRQEAVDKMKALNPTVIALSGSYGKTSTKHILHHILSAANPCLMTPGSVNTEMGITRIIRENLRPEHDYFIVEMGAYGPGSIARLCALTPPDQGLITSIGMAHYERFKSVDTVFAAKFELAEAVHQNNGSVTLNTDAIPERLLKPRLASDTGFYLLAGANDNGYDNDLVLQTVEEKADGLHLTLLVGKEREKHQLHAPIYGTMQAGNILVSVATALSLGYPMAVIKASLRDLPQTRHRLEYVRFDHGPSVLDDAFNSNPVGFEAALNSLKAVTPEGGRRILITPGMVELGERHESEHRRLGELAGEICDVILVITPERIPSFLSGAQATADSDTEILTFDTQEEGQAWLDQFAAVHDVILYENNLPDIFEQRVIF